MSSTNDLHQAIINQDVNTIKKILEEEAAWKPMDSEGETVLHLAFKCKYEIVLRQKSIIETLECLLNEGLSIDLKNAAGRTILFLAIENRLRHVTDFLMQHGANVNAQDRDGNTIVHFMIEKQSKEYSNRGPIFQDFMEQDHINSMTWLLSMGVNVHLRNNDGKTVFNLAFQQNLKHILPTLIKHMNDVNYIVEDGSKIVKLLSLSWGNVNTKYDSEIIDSLLTFVNRVDRKGSTIVHAFLKWYGRDSEMIQRILQGYTNVNAQDQDGNTALYLVIRNSIYHQYVRHRTIDAIHTLVSKGARVDLKNRMGDAPVRLAVRAQNIKVLKVLLEHRADVNPSTHPRAQFLHHVGNVRNIVDHLWAPMVDTFVRAGWNVNAVRRHDQFTPLMEACRAKNPAVAQKLIDNGADVNYFEKRNLMRPIHLAAMACRSNQRVNTEALIKILLKAGAMVNVKNGRGETALHLLVHCGYNAVEILLKSGAHVDTRDKEGRSPLQEAVKRRNVGAIEALLKFGADINDARVLEELNKLLMTEQAGDEMQRRIQILLDPSNDPVTLQKRATVECLMKHWLKLKAANLPVIYGYVDFMIKESLQEFYIECLGEVETLKANNLNDCMKVFYLLHMDVRFKYAFMAINEKLKEFVKSPLLQTAYPKYYSCILACYNKALARYPLIEPAKRAWDYLIGIRLPDCVEHILAYLDNEDLRVMAGLEEVKSLKRSSQLASDESDNRKRLK